MNTLCVLYAVVFHSPSMSRQYPRFTRRGIKVITHLILGLPGETTDDMRASVRYLAAHPVFGVKLQLLHVLEGTDLGTLYKNDPFPLFTLEEYCDLIADCLALLPPEMVIHRLTVTVRAVCSSLRNGARTKSAC